MSCQFRGEVRPFFAGFVQGGEMENRGALAAEGGTPSRAQRTALLCSSGQATFTNNGNVPRKFGFQAGQDKGAAIR